ncbi:transglutaminase domain-containing protein [Dactylosporangium aurantiacum]|uniref:Transglutaminase domain-containing protein n=1 Tax=Dactylosporangium aurantiacum TaxID=35754 RepID=A0A9Q9IFB9_9ACTN|nr:transglutaminase domain-containing protein [Dactylosporangium aurantiacum]MDG6108871.1 transglutaminase domain-containing protein [Dactylosporangium aurantiacum]UWZ52168.1 transglutaminase domain-containing protein [Dactylosporangium aurantiacum]
MVDRYRSQSAYSDPGPHAALLDRVPTDVPGLVGVVRNVIVHYYAQGLSFVGERLAEVDSRWVSRILTVDRSRHTRPLGAPREPKSRVVGCARDFALLTVATLRHRRVAARTRIGFAGYFGDAFHYDHVVAEYWNGERWVRVDAQLDPGTGDVDPFDVRRFITAAEAWTAHRREEIDPDNFGADPVGPYRGHRFLLDQVRHELAHRQRDELLLWDEWGSMDEDLADWVAQRLVAADAGDAAAEDELAARYAADPALHPGGRVHCVSPSGLDAWVDV